MILTSAYYSRSESHNDSVIQLQDNSVAQILGIYLQTNGNCCLKVQCLNIEPLSIKDMRIEHIWKILSSPQKHKIVDVSHVQSQLLALDFDKMQYVCSTPNCFEKQ